jgi:hypothetical protein
VKLFLSTNIFYNLAIKINRLIFPLKHYPSHCCHGICVLFGQQLFFSSCSVSSDNNMGKNVTNHYYSALYWIILHSKFIIIISLYRQKCLFLYKLWLTLGWCSHIIFSWFWNRLMYYWMHTILICSNSKFTHFIYLC